MHGLRFSESPAPTRSRGWVISSSSVIGRASFDTPFGRSAATCECLACGLPGGLTLSSNGRECRCLRVDDRLEREGEHRAPSAAAELKIFLVLSATCRGVPAFLIQSCQTKSKHSAAVTV